MKMEIKKINVDDIKVAEYNPRKIDGDDYIKLYNGLTEFGLVLPLLINLKDKILISGHQRLKVLKDMGLKELNLIEVGDIGWVFNTDNIEIKNEYWEKALNLSLNNIHGDFDKEKLKEIFNNLDKNKLDINISGFDIEELTELNANEIDNGLKYFSDEEIIKVMDEDFEKFKNNKEIVDYLIDIPQAKYEFNELCKGTSKIGTNISLLFNPHRFETLTVKSNLTMLELFNKKHDLVCKKIVEVYNNVGTKRTYPKMVGLNYGGFQLVNEFHPYTARDIYKKYCKNGDKIINQCAGWGGRLIGFASCLFNNSEYWETDPSKETYKGLLELKEFLRLGDNIKQFNKPFEDLELPEDYFDFAFTSPPYFNTELYSDDEEQSFKRNDSYEKWREDFLYVLVDKTIESLKEDGICLLNVGNNKYPIDADLIDYVNNEYKLKTKRISLFKIGGSGFGKRSGESGEPFIEFKKNREL